MGICLSEDHPSDPPTTLASAGALQLPDAQHGAELAGYVGSDQENWSRSRTSAGDDCELART